VKPTDVAKVEQAIGIPVADWGGRCHEISIAIVRTMYAPGEARVARGWCDGVPGQHSWVVLGMDCYDPDALIIDATLWSYLGETPQLWIGTMEWEAELSRHRPHGQGSIWAWGRPQPPTGPVVELTPRKPWSPQAELFLELLGPLDREGWIRLAHAPVERWPAGEIIDALCESGFEGYVPIDIVGMVTDRNPMGIYLREVES
jgi:hypothetical protein